MRGLIRLMISRLDAFFAQRRLDPEMWSAICAQDRRRIEKLVKQGYDPNRVLKRCTLLERAVYWDDRKLIDFLLERQVRFRKNPWLLYNAVKNGNLHFVRLAVQQGLDINDRRRR